jgi:2-desacetyl-2-hydroxyethyl bacteriochlorophyllide A dehydrogenase
MKALICTEPGNFEYKDIPEPIQLPGQTLLSIKRVGICGTDIHAFDGTQPFFQYPRILGHELAATIISTDNPDFVSGETVTVLPYFNCGHCVACNNGKPNCCVQIKVCGVHIDGGMQEILSVPSDSLIKSEGLSLDALALVEPLSIGEHAVERAGIKDGENVLIVGAGPIGLGLMDMARLRGANVIAMDVNETRLNVCSNYFKVAHIINPIKDNAMEKLLDITHADMPTVIIDATGSLNAINNSLQYLAHGGRYVLVGLQKAAFSFSHPEFHKRETSLMSSRNASRANFEHVIQYMKQGLVDPNHYISHRFDFEAVAGAFPGLTQPENATIKAMISMP